MSSLLENLDRLAGTTDDSRTVLWFERIAFAFLLLMVASAPHSIAATQTAWLTGMFAWLISLVLRWKSGSVRQDVIAPKALHIALWAFFGWSVITSLTSYAPDISINKLRGVAVFLIFYFVAGNIRNRRAAHVLAFVLVGSCMINVLWTPAERLIGRGVEMQGVVAGGPMSKAVLIDGDTLLEANGVKVRTPEDVLAAIESNEVTKVKFYRPDFEFVVDVKRADLLPGNDAMTRLGFSSWKKSRNWRSSGFYGHYTTYAEVLQLIASLVMGLFVGTISRKFFASKEGSGVSRSSLVLLFCLAAMSLALLLTVTRASQLAFLISACVIVLIGLGRKWLIVGIAVAVPIAIAGLLFLQQSRQVGFFDQNDVSIRWRQTIWREGFDLWTSSPRNFVLGVGMDSIKRFAPEWHLFADGRLPSGHFHSTPLNLVVERGLPALLLWLIVLGVYARTLWRGLNPKSKIQNLKSTGVLLGCFGGMVGFFTSGMVHYNLGDQEVAMIFFMLMGLAVRVGHEQLSPVVSE